MGSVVEGNCRFGDQFSATSGIPQVVDVHPGRVAEDLVARGGLHVSFIPRNRQTGNSKSTPEQLTGNDGSC
jgi:hypothetical protein